MALAERLIAMYDSFEPEVLLELEVIEISSTRLTELGIQVPKSVSLTPLAPVGESRLTLGNLRGIGRDRIGVSVDDVVLNLRREVGDFRMGCSARRWFPSAGGNREPQAEFDLDQSRCQVGRSGSGKVNAPPRSITLGTALDLAGLAAGSNSYHR